MLGFTTLNLRASPRHHHSTPNKEKSIILKLSNYSYSNCTTFHDYKRTSLIGFRYYTNMENAQSNPLKPNSSWWWVNTWRGESLAREEKFWGCAWCVVEFIEYAIISPVWCMEINNLMKWRKWTLWWFMRRLCWF